MFFACLNNPLIIPQSEQDKNEARPVQTDKPAYLPNARMTVKKKVKDKKKVIDISDIVGSAEDINRRLQEQIEGPKAMFSEDGPVGLSLICCELADVIAIQKMIEQEILPHVYTATGNKSVSLSQGGKFALPEGTKREYSDVGRPFPLTVR